jgi:hypothetical protein
VAHCFRAFHDDSRLVTDGASVYKAHVVNQESVDHSKYEWARGDVAQLAFEWMKKRR